MIAAITSNRFVDALIWVVVVAVIYYILDWGRKELAMKEPFDKVARVILALLAVVFLINALLMIVGKPFIPF